jgi:hypothetical protein
MEVTRENGFLKIKDPSSKRKVIILFTIKE